MTTSSLKNFQQDSIQNLFSIKTWVRHGTSALICYPDFSVEIMNSSNGTAYDFGSSDNYLTLEVLLYVIFMTFALLLAVASNGLVIYCVARLRKLRTVTNIFICNLSVSDIILSGFVMPQRLHDITHSSEDFYEGRSLNIVVSSRFLLESDQKAFYFSGRLIYQSSSSPSSSLSSSLFL